MVRINLGCGFSAMPYIYNRRSKQQVKMMSRKLLKALMLVPLCVLLTPLHAEAAELTRVLTSADFDNDQPFSMDLSPSFRHRIERSQVTREGLCDPSQQQCPVYNSELDVLRTRMQLDVDLAIGIYRDFQFHMTLPIVFNDTLDLEFSEGVSGANSSIAPDASRNPPTSPPQNTRYPYRYFDLPGGRLDGPQRSGLGDMSFGIAWAPFSNDRTPYVSTVVLGLDYTAPTGQPMRGDNTSVGRGLHELNFRLAASRRLSIIDPYMQIGYALPIRSPNSLFRDYGNTQRTVTPGMRGEITAGTEFILFSDDDSGQHYTIKLGLDFGYTAEGRDYSPLFQGLATSECNGTTLNDVGLSRYNGERYPPEAGLDPNIDPADRACAWIVQQTANAADGPESYNRSGMAFHHDGITDIDAHLTYGMHAGLSLQFAPMARLQFGFRGETATPHGITSSNSGRSATGQEVNLDPARGERNPFYNPTLDYIGNRFRQEQIFNFEWMLRFSLQFD